MTLKKDEIAIRIAGYRRELGLNQTEFGILFGKTKAAVSQWENQVTIPERDSLLTLQKNKGINPDWILCDSEQKTTQKIAEKNNHYSALELGPRLPERMQQIPVVGTAQLGPDGFWDSLDYPPGYGDGHIKFYSTDENAYALRVKGDSMSPAIRNGWLVVVEPNRDYATEDLVVVCTTDGQCMVKEFYAKRGDEFVFLSINPDYKKLTISKVNIIKIHTVSAIIPPKKYNPW